jgi:putative ABC transport system permease protein
MGQLALFVRGLWWRRGFCAAVLIVATLTTAVAVLGPLYARAAGESTLSDRLADSPADGAGLAFIKRVDISAATLPGPGSVPGYPSRILGASIAGTANTIDPALSNTTLVWRDGQCAHLIIVTGACPSGPGQALVDDNALHARPNW